SAAEHRDEFPPPHRANPNPTIIRSIAGQGRASQQKRPAHVWSWVIRVGCVIRPWLRHVRFAPKADKQTIVSACLLSAISGCEQSQQSNSYSITSSARPGHPISRHSPLLDLGDPRLH